MAKAGKKKCVLELGGNAACIVDRDAKVDEVIERLIFGAFYQSGQSCIRSVAQQLTVCLRMSHAKAAMRCAPVSSLDHASVQRVYVHQDIYDEVKAKFVARTATLKAGDPLNEV